MKMKPLYLIASIGFLASCNFSENKSSDQQSRPDTLSEELSEEQSKWKSFSFSKDSIQEKVFELGSKTHFTDTCAFYFECDCCSGDLVLNPDQTFYEIDYCMSNSSLRHGKYKLKGDTLVLNFDGICIKREYNWENEIDTSAVDYFVTDTIFEPLTHFYNTTKCNSRIQLIKVDGEGIGIETSRNYKEFLEILREQELLGRLEEVKRKPN